MGSGPRITDFDYELPPAAIAQTPLGERDASRLLILERRTGRVEHRTFRDLPDLLSPSDLLVVNRSRVFPARLLGRRTGGGAAEALLVRRVGGATWEALVRPGRRLRPGHEIIVSPELSLRIESEAVGHDGRRRVRLLAPDPEAAIARFGHTPLPPYIRRADSPSDQERYQTVYARDQGSVAAPTAGLHFTTALLERLEQRGLRKADVVLHVGPGTFRPVTVDDVSEHRVEPEPFTLPPETAAALAATRARGGRVLAVGTTTVRVLETAALQGDPVPSRDGETDLVIVPGFPFRVTDALLTNFHLPRSSLLLLVSAFAGRESVLAAYRDALHRGYRFYSYGDAMLIL
jgi:S-adenosylmethionine:tRNA ribosyltransferase-isomerase